MCECCTEPKDPKVSIVVPLLNEQENLPALFCFCFNFLRKQRVGCYEGQTEEDKQDSFHHVLSRGDIKYGSTLIPAQAIRGRPGYEPSYPCNDIPCEN